MGTSGLCSDYIRACSGRCNRESLNFAGSRSFFSMYRLFELLELERILYYSNAIDILCNFANTRTELQYCAAV